jgi:endoglycosylceramidase
MVGIAGCSSHATSRGASPTTARAVVVASPEGTISHAGRWLIDDAGRVVILHGVNMVEKRAPYYPAAAGG